MLKWKPDDRLTRFSQPGGNSSDILKYIIIHKVERSSRDISFNKFSDAKWDFENPDQVVGFGLDSFSRTQASRF